jgi:hypothetical protein
MYKQHPSNELNELFTHKPYQGVAPSQATFLFVGLDANYDADISGKPIFTNVIEYHDDGVAFWKRHGVHHPFLLPTYIGDGRHYHRSFARIGFRPQHAGLVSFAELLNVPTVGRNKLEPLDFDKSYLKMLNAAILEGDAQHVFLPREVSRLMRASGEFDWLPVAPIDNSDELGILHRSKGKTVYSHLHFSVYGKFEAAKVAQARAIRSLLPPTDHL